MRHLLLLTILAFAVRIQAEDLREKLETNYLSFAEALKAKDSEKLKTTISTHNYVLLKNQLVSSKAKFPDDLFQMAPTMVVNLKKLKFLKTTEKGPTANAVYFGKTPVGDNEFVILKFVKEGNDWKYDGEAEKQSDELKQKLSAKDLSFLNEKDFLPSGVMPATPKEVTPLDYKGVIDVSGVGYRVTVKVNGVEQFTIEDGKQSTLILGGLKKGYNSIDLKITPIHGKEQEKVSVSIKGFLRKGVSEVFAMEQDKPSLMITKEFEIK